ncbi:MAG: tetratricopeptide repeat protein [Sphingosinicella sp.]|uniref:tetratricopeptide repeat protein n=1 Tax=Sphingosinicella sp. TaxID=1917971 RepID=UPI004037E300
MKKSRKPRPTKAAAIRAPLCADFLIIAALEEERDAVLRALGRPKKLDKEPADIHTYHAARVKSSRRDGSTYDVVVTCLLNMGPVSAAAQAALVAGRWKPKYVLLVGIACGVRGEVELGDVLIATQVADYTLGKRQNGEREIRWNVSPCAASLLDCAINISAAWGRGISTSRPGDGVPTPRKGVVASGGDVVSDDEVVADYNKYWPKLVGIEMEAGGVAQALHQAPERPDFLMVKSVSDFGSDKHDPDVLPWRPYACDVAAAFARAVIESGPFAKVPTDPRQEKREEEVREAERRWSYLQDQEVLGVDVLFILKSPVGREWLERVLENTRISFSRDGPSYKLAITLKLAPAPNTKEFSYRWEQPLCAFWEVYEADPSIWVRRVWPEPRKFTRVSGFEAQIPWSAFKLDFVKLRELAQCDHVGMGIPPEAFSAGVKEFRVRFHGDQFTFSLDLSDHGLEFLHEMASTHHRVADGKPQARLSLGTGFSGIQLLEMFRKQLFPEFHETERKKQGVFGGIGGVGGRSISFYPAMPPGFMKSAEADEYTVRIKVPDTKGIAARITELEAAVESNTADADTYGELAARYSNDGRLLDAIRCLEQAIVHGCDTPDIHGLLGESLYHLGRIEEAFNHYSIAAGLEPESANAQCGLGMCKSALGNNAEAFEHFEVAARLAPSQHSHQANYGMALAQQERYQEAIPVYEHALKLAPHDSNSLLFLAILYDCEGDFESAKSRLEEAIRIGPNDAEAREHLGRILAKAGNHEEALPLLRHAIEIEPTKHRYELLGGSLEALQEWEKGEAAFRDALALEPDDPQSLLGLGVMIANQQRHAEAIPYIEAALKSDPCHAEGIKLLAQVREAAVRHGQL